MTNCTDPNCKKEHGMVFIMGLNSGVGTRGRYHLTEEELAQRAKYARELKQFNEAYDTLDEREQEIHRELNELIDELGVPYVGQGGKLDIIKFAKKIAQI